LKSLFIFIFFLLAQAAIGQIAIDPYFQSVTLPTNISRIHATGFGVGPSGSNYLACATRPTPTDTTSYFIAVNASNINQYNYFYFDTNHIHDCPQLVWINHNVYCLVTETVQTSQSQSFWGIIQINPDTLVTNVVYSNTEWSSPGSDGSLATDGSNLYVIGGYIIEKIATNGSVLLTNTFKQSPFLPTNGWIGQSGHSISFNGSKLLVAGNTRGSTGQYSIMVVNPSDLTFSWITISPTNQIGTNYNSGGQPNVILTDDSTAFQDWVFEGDEGSGSGVVWCGRQSDGYSIGIETGILGTPCYGVAFDNKYVWSEWAKGFLCRFNPAEITNGVVEIDTVTLGTNRPIFNELVFNTNSSPTVYYATDWLTTSSGPTHIYRFSSPDFYSRAWSYTNGQAYVPPTLLQMH